MLAGLGEPRDKDQTLSETDCTLIMWKGSTLPRQRGQLTFPLPLMPAILSTAAGCFCYFSSVLFGRLKSSPFCHLSFPNNKKNPFLLNFLSIYKPLDKAGHMQVTFNLIPPIDFNGCEIRIPEANVFELTESPRSFPPCLPPFASKHL